MFIARPAFWTCSVSSLLFIRQPLWAIRFWGISILISLVAGNAVGNIFAGLGFDDRTHYFNDASLGESAATSRHSRNSSSAVQVFALTSCCIVQCRL